MAQAVLIVEQDDVRRAELRAAFMSRGVPVYEVGDAVDAMVALGRANFGALLASEGKRQLSLRGLCLLARRRHPGIRLVVLSEEDISEEAFRERLGIEVDLLPADVHAREVVDAVLAVAPSLLSAFDLPGETEVLSGPQGLTDDSPRTDSGSAPTWHTPRGGSFSSTTDEPATVVEAQTTRMVPAPREDFGEATLIDEDAHMDVPSLDDVEPLSADMVSSLDDQPPAPVASPLHGIHVADPTLVDLRQIGGAGPFASQEASGQARVAEARRALLSFSDTPDTDPVSAGATLRGAEGLSEHVILEGTLDEVGGAPLLMGICTQELTGRLEASLPSGHATLYFHVGEPVGAGHPEGDAGLFEVLFARGFIRGARRRPAAPEGELYSALIESGALTGERLHELLRTWLGERLHELLSTSAGSYRFIESDAFLRTLPLCRVDPFGATRALCSERHAADLFVEAARVARQWMLPAAPLAVCAPRILAFSGGKDLAAIVGKGAAVRDVIDAIGLDDLEGTLLVLTLEATRLIELLDLPPAQDSFRQVVLDTAPTVQVPRIPDANDSGERSAEEAALREEIFALYMRLKPLTRPSQVLGVSLGATLDEVEGAYRRRMAMLDPVRVGEGPSGELLRSRIDELRAKLTHAYEAARLQLEATGKNTPAGGGPKGGSNPW